MTLTVDVQIVSDENDLPEPAIISRWARAAIGDRRDDAELTVRIVDGAEGTRLNETYRPSARRDAGPTNVLSFPFEPPPGVSLALLGDVVVCAPVVKREAREQSKSPDAHWAHMVVHGTLHLLGYDHRTPADAQEMESLECRILARLGFPDPYAVKVE